MMKKFLNIFVLVGMTLALTACQDDNAPARTPLASVEVNKTDLIVNESMELHFNGVADQVVVYTGDAEHNYYERGTYEDPDGAHPNLRQGLVVNKGLLTYSYSAPGTYTVVVVATCYDTFMGGGRKEDVCEFEVRVSDDCTTISQISISTPINTFYAEQKSDTDWLLVLPTNQVNGKKDVSLNASRQRISISVPSSATKIEIDGGEYKPTEYKDLSVSHDILLTSDAGGQRAYKLYTLIYPEFTSVTASGVSAVLTRNAFYQDMLTYAIDASMGTMVEFALPADVTFTADGAPLESGCEIDLSGNTHYALVRTMQTAEGKTLEAVTRVLFERQ